jgi:hypothetical protein
MIALEVVDLLAENSAVVQAISQVLHVGQQDPSGVVLLR